MSEKSIKLLPFIYGDLECNIIYCAHNECGQCESKNIDMLRYTLDYIGKKLIMHSERREATLDESTMFTCTYYELAEKRCPECKSELKYSEKEVNYVCYVCGHGIRD